MRLHFLVEGRSEKAFLESWLPRFLPSPHTFRIIPHRGKGRIPGDPSKKPDPKRQGLLDQLPAKLRAFGKEFKPETDRVLVLVDLDRDNCHDLKQRLTNLIEYCDPPPTTLFRIAIEETEAFYLGDRHGIKKAFPRAKINKLNSYTQDSICGAWELFQDVINARFEDKVEWGRKIGPCLTIKWKGSKANKSVSFQHFCKAILCLVGEPI